VRHSYAAIPCGETTAVLTIAAALGQKTGSRRTVSASGKAALLFWYRDAVYAVEPRSPAEGAYSEGFAEARLTQVRRVV
jgi:hypothetical protein